MPYNLKGRIYTIGKQLKDLKPEFEKRGMYVTSSEISKAIKGEYNCKKGDLVLSTANEIDEQWEKEAKLAKEKTKADLQQTSH